MSIEVATNISHSDIRRVFGNLRSAGEDAEDVLCRAIEAIHSVSDLDSAFASKVSAIAENCDVRQMEWIVPIICALAELYPSAKAIISELAVSKNVICRLGAIYTLSPRLSDEFTFPILAVLISDRKSVKVRAAAVDWIGRHYKSEFEGLLSDALKTELNKTLQSLIADELTLLQLGYLVDRNIVSPSITAQGTLGRISKSLLGEPIEGKSDAEIFKRFVSELRASLLGGELVADIKGH